MPHLGSFILIAYFPVPTHQ